MQGDDRAALAAARFGAQQFCRAHAQIVIGQFKIVAVHAANAARADVKLQFVGEIQELKMRVQFVHAVGAARADMQIKVDLRRGRPVAARAAPVSIPIFGLRALSRQRANPSNFAKGLSR